RIGLSEAFFRELNERIESAAGSFGLDDQPLNCVCACGDSTCTEQIATTRSDYETLRKHPTHFAVFPGHETVEVEEIVDRRKGYDVIRKHEGQPEQVARETNPRD